VNSFRIVFNGYFGAHCPLAEDKSFYAPLNRPWQTRDVTLVRARISMQNVTWHPLPGTTVAHVRIAAFSQGVSNDLQKALAEIKAQGMTGIILDLRNDPGGCWTR
jgi:carboxyl-terminal processing protease